MDKLGYVIGPYRDFRGEYYVNRNIRRAERVALDLWRLGFPVICPHMNTRMWTGAAPDDVWLSGDLVMMKRCDFVFVVPDEVDLKSWRDSSGSIGELKVALKAGIPMFNRFHALEVWAGHHPTYEPHSIAPNVMGGLSLVPFADTFAKFAKFINTVA